MNLLRVPLLTVALTMLSLLLASNAVADEINSVAPDGTVTATLVRGAFDGEPKVRVTVLPPPGWKRWKNYAPDDTSISFVPGNSTDMRPALRLAVTYDNLDAASRERTLNDDVVGAPKKIQGGGKAVALTKVRELTLGKSARARVVSLDIDATKQRAIHYVETRCYAYVEDQQYLVALIGMGELKDKALITAFEKSCESLRITTP